jgi:chromosome segregation ATPase
MRPVPQSVEDRISNIEEELRSLRKSLEARTAELRASIESTRPGLRSDITAVSTHLQELRSKVEESTVGGFKLQIFGVLLAIYGAFVSIGAQ